MIAPQIFNNYPEFGSAALKCCPDATRYANGYIQGDVLPAEHLNWFLSGATVGVSALQLGLDSIEKEMQTLLCCSGIAACASCYSQIYDAITYQIQQSAATKAPTNHASSATTYGVGNASNYGHLKISDTYTSVLSNCSGVAASQQALVCVYNAVTTKAGLGNTEGCALGTASAGVAGTAARSDHVHPMPTCVACAGNAITLSGYELCGAACPYTVAMRVDGGNLYAAHFNTLVGIENYTCFPGAAIAFVDADGWIRKTSEANITAGNAYHADCAESALSACHLCLKNGSGVFYTDSNWVYAETGTQQPSFVWGTNDGVNNAIWDPSKFNVARACASSYALASYLKVSTCSFIGGGIAQIFYCATNLDMPWQTNSLVVMDGIKAGSSCQFDFNAISGLPTLIKTADGKTMNILCVDSQWHLVASCPDETGGIFVNTYYAQLASLVA